MGGVEGDGTFPILHKVYPEDGGSCLVLFFCCLPCPCAGKHRTQIHVSSSSPLAKVSSQRRRHHKYQGCDDPSRQMGAQALAGSHSAARPSHRGRGPESITGPCTERRRSPSPAAGSAGADGAAPFLAGAFARSDTAAFWRTSPPLRAHLVIHSDIPLATREENIPPPRL